MMKSGIVACVLSLLLLSAVNMEAQQREPRGPGAQRGQTEVARPRGPEPQRGNLSDAPRSPQGMGMMRGQPNGSLQHGPGLRPQPGPRGPGAGRRVLPPVGQHRYPPVGPRIYGRPWGSPWYSNYSRYPDVYAYGMSGFGLGDFNFTWYTERESENVLALNAGKLKFAVTPKFTVVVCDGYYVGAVRDLGKGVILPAGEHVCQLGTQEFRIYIVAGETVTIRAHLN